MSIDIIEALKYPFREERIQDAIVIPGIIVFILGVLSIVFSLLLLGVLYFGFHLTDPKTLKTVGNGLQNVVQLPFNILIGIVMLGFKWHTVANWQNDGLEADPPNWRDDWKEILWDGFKLSCFYWLFSTLMTLLGLVVFGVPLYMLMGNKFDLDALQGIGSIVFIIFAVTVGLLCLVLFPFYEAVLFQSAQERSFANLFNFQRTIRWGFRCYPLLIIAMLGGVVVGIAYTTAMTLGAVLTCCIGILAFPFLTGPMMLSSAHLYAQAFEENLDELLSEG